MSQLPADQGMRVHGPDFRDSGSGAVPHFGGMTQTDSDAGSSTVGVLTFHRCINYGSYWQARCLVEGLARRGYRALLLDHNSTAIDVAEWKVALKPTQPTPVPKEDVPAYACKVRKFLADIDKLPLSRRFDIDRPEEMPKVETVVIGSDEVWNLRHPWFAQKPAFFGEGLRADRVVAYAASFGNYSCWEGIGSPWTDMIGRLGAVSVRDENSWWMLRNSIGLRADTVLDPCLQFPMEPEGEWKGPAGRFAVVYGHNFTPEFAVSVREWARSRGFKLLSVGYRNDWADLQWLDAGPHDFAHAVAQSEGVATNFFHGCVFALLDRKPFACEPTRYRSIKVQGLLELLGAEAHRYAGALGTLLDERPSPSILTRIDEVRMIGDLYLSRALMETRAYVA